MSVFYHPGGKSARISSDAKLGTHYDYDAGWYYEVTGYWYDGYRCYGEYKTQAKAEAAKARHIYHAKWAQIWRKAMNNMPTRVRREKIWVSREPGTTPLADYIRKSVKGKMKVVDNVVYEYTLSDIIHYGQQSALAVLMGYPIRKGGHNQVYANLNRGSKPRDVEKQLLLLDLAGEGGKELALNLLINKHGRGKYYK